MGHNHLPTNEDFHNQTTSGMDDISRLMDSVYPKIVKFMETWELELANGETREGSFEKLGNGQEIKLEKVTKFVELKQIDGKAVELVSFNLIGHIGLRMPNGEFLQDKNIEYALENFDPRLLTRQKVIIQQFAPVAK